MQSWAALTNQGRKSFGDEFHGLSRASRPSPTQLRKSSHTPRQLHRMQTGDSGSRIIAIDTRLPLAVSVFNNHENIDKLKQFSFLCSSLSFVQGPWSFVRPSSGRQQRGPRTQDHRTDQARRTKDPGLALHEFGKRSSEDPVVNAARAWRGNSRRAPATFRAAHT
jgi:hypothetical protein